MKPRKLSRKTHMIIFLWFSTVFWGYITGREQWISYDSNEALIRVFGWIWVAWLLASLRLL
jgi:hypothetical protein